MLGIQILTVIRCTSFTSISIVILCCSLNITESASCGWVCYTLQSSTFGILVRVPLNLPMTETELVMCSSLTISPHLSNLAVPTTDSAAHCTISFKFCTVSRTKFPVFTTRCTLVQSAVLRSHVVCPSVRPSVCL